MKVTIYTTQGDQIHALFPGEFAIVEAMTDSSEMLRLILDSDPPKRGWIRKSHVYLIEFDEPEMETAEPESEEP